MTRDLGPAAHSAVACPACRRRSWLLGDLSALLDYHRGDPARLAALLELDGRQLIAALAGNRRSELIRAWGELRPDGQPEAPGAGLCAHVRSWPSRVGGAGERMLWLSSSAERFVRLARAPAVAIIGSPAASPYGGETAAGLARGLAAAGVTIVAGLTGELARAAHLGAAEGRGPSLAVAGDGLERIRPAQAARLARQVAREGCVVSELPAQVSGRGWGAVAAERTALELGNLTILIEGEQEERSTKAARAALGLGRMVGVVPGPVTSHLSTGPHALLIEGAGLIRDAGDALELLCQGRPRPEMTDARPLKPREPALELRLRKILERVGAGEDTAEGLTRGAPDEGSVLAALGELEAIGLVRRLPGGRYVPRQPAPRGARPG